MSLIALDNLVRIGQLKAEPRNLLEATRCSNPHGGLEAAPKEKN